MAKGVIRTKEFLFSVTFSYHFTPCIVITFLTMCGKLFSAIPRTSVTPTLLSDSILS